MKKIKKRILIGCILIAITQHGFCQTDTAALVDEFRKIISFSDQPLVYYNTVTKLTASPIMLPEDTLTLAGVYYKNDNLIYSDNGRDETYVQDSLLFRVSKARKSIWINKAASATGEENASDPFNNNNMEVLFQKKYSIKKNVLGNGNNMISFDTRPDTLDPGGLNTSITLEYTSKNSLPIRLEMEMRIKQPASEELEDALKKEGINTAKVMQRIDGKEYFIRIQKMSIAFSGVDYSKEKLKVIPLWNERIDYDKTSGEFRGKGIYSGYEIAKMF